MNKLQQINNKLIQRNYASSTIGTYLTYLKKYFAYCVTHKLDSAKDADPFIRSMIKANLSISAQNQAINAIKFYWEQILDQPRTFISIDRPMKEKKLPTVLSKDEVKRVFSATANLKHKIILKTVYACGLRIGELIKLKIKHIDGERKTIFIEQSKGKKDRLVPLPNSLLLEFRRYYKQYKPKTYLIEGPELGTQYSTSSCNRILKRALKIGNIKKYATMHDLRHSYATHLYEHGVNLRSIQVLLGHNSSRTTEIYTHVTNRHLNKTPSPLDFLDQE